MWKQFLIVLVITIACNAQNEVTSATSRGKIKHQLHYLTHYWVFLAIKAKIIFLIGTFISFWVFAGKLFAFLYYYKGKENCHCPEYHDEKIVIPESPPHYEHKYSTMFNAGSPDDVYFPGPPGNGLYYGKKPPQPSSYGGYSRSIKNSIFGNLDLIKSIIKKADVTELTFDAMNLKENACKKRFVCEANTNAERNSLLAIGLYMFSDNGLIKYKTNKKITSIEDCFSLGPHCDNT